ncbi:hypothetical protein KCP77_12005 [Salmonella enterica subsp. enterica]|nr:hypothetical protein KCP77_12005 [Salmonella enterica subsp. enterica]
MATWTPEVNFIEVISEVALKRHNGERWWTVSHRTKHWFCWLGCCAGGKCITRMGRNEAKPFSGLNHFTKPVIFVVIILLPLNEPLGEMALKELSEEKPIKRISRGTNDEKYYNHYFR